jgi:hydroxyacylglutathione hydrolase
MSTPPPLIFNSLEIGPLGNLIYFVGDPKTRNVAVVDPAWDKKVILKEAQKNGWQISAILLTHGHFDHTNAVNDLLNTIDVPVYISRHEAKFHMPDCPNLRLTSDRDIIRIGELDVECLHTPGHTPGCQCYRIRKILLTKDTLFVDGCGRCDLPGGDAKVMYKSLSRLIASLPDDIVIYPGHGYGSQSFATLGQQKKTNPFLQFPDEQSFLNYFCGAE